MRFVKNGNFLINIFSGRNQILSNLRLDIFYVTKSFAYIFIHFWKTFNKSS